MKYSIVDLIFCFKKKEPPLFKKYCGCCGDDKVISLLQILLSSFIPNNFFSKDESDKNEEKNFKSLIKLSVPVL